MNRMGGGRGVFERSVDVESSTNWPHRTAHNGVILEFHDQEAVLAIFEQQIPPAAQREYEEFIQALRDRYIAETARRHRIYRFRRSAVVLMVVSVVAAVAFSHYQWNSTLPRICIAVLVILGIVLFCMGPQDK